MVDLRYPIGPYHDKHPVTRLDRREMLSRLAAIPDAMQSAVEELSSMRLDMPYRPGGWTVRQVVHHLPDSHANWYIRMRLALTEDEPIIKPYAENLWAELQDACAGPVDSSLLLLAGLHQRLVLLLESLEPADWSRTLVHPEHGRMTLDAILPILVWHGLHHTAHITELRTRMGWN